MSSIYDWSTTAATNSSSDSLINWAEGQAPSSVNNSARQVMGRVAELLDDLGGSISAGGTANVLTVTAISSFTAYADGLVVAFRATADNTGAATLSVNSVGAKAIRKMDSTGDVALVAGEIQNTGIYVVQYSTALNGGAGAWLLVNPTLSAAIYALSGLTTTDNAVARFDSTAGKLQNSGVIIDDSDNLKAGSGTVTTVTSANQLQAVGATVAGILIENTSATGSGFLTFGDGAIAGRVTYDHSANDMEFITNGSTALTLSSAGTGTFVAGITATTGTFSGALQGTVVTGTTAFRSAAGSAATAAYSVTGDTNTGLFFPVADEVAMSSGGSEIWRTNGSGLNVGRVDVLSMAAAEYGLSLETSGLLQVARNAAVAMQVKRNGDGAVLNWFNGTSAAGNVSNAGTTTTYNTTSDYRLKGNIRDLENSGAFIDALRPRTFEWLASGQTASGFIAHEFAEVSPGSVTGKKDGREFQAMQASSSEVMANIIAEVKALRARVAALEA